MANEHRYELTATWTGNRGEGTAGVRSYTRDVTLSIAGKPELLGSADRAFFGDASRWNPEDMLLAALAQCHLLSYLRACVLRGVVVTDYTDAASGVMEQEGESGRFTSIVLRPAVMREAAVEAHHDAHNWCFIANSVSFPVTVEPTVSVG